MRFIADTIIATAICAIIFAPLGAGIVGMLLP